MTGHLQRIHKTLYLWVRWLRRKISATARRLFHTIWGGLKLMCPQKIKAEVWGLGQVKVWAKTHQGLAETRRTPTHLSLWRVCCLEDFLFWTQGLQWNTERTLAGIRHLICGACYATQYTNSAVVRWQDHQGGAPRDIGEGIRRRPALPALSAATSCQMLPNGPCRLLRDGHFATNVCLS